MNCYDNCSDGKCNPLQSLNKAFSKYLNMSKCQEILENGEQCKTRPVYNMPDQKKGIYCAPHKKEGMVDVKNPTCQEILENGEQCETQPVYNMPDQKKGIYCAPHKKEGMVDVVNPTCQHILENGERCKTIPVYNMPDQKKGIYCAPHKKEGMVDVKNPMCQHILENGERCKTIPYYNMPDQKKGIYCAPHKKEGMVDVVSPTCQHILENGERCETRPNYNMPNQKKRIYCVSHKKEGMVNVVSPTCQHILENGEQCKTQPHYNMPNQKKGIYCATHKKEGMVDVKNPSCQTPLCETLANRKYQGYCYGCFIQTFPNNPIVRNHKTKERYVADYIRNQFPDYTIIFDKPIENGCSSRRPDIFMDFGEFVMIIEIDENQHQVYDCSCENKRLMQLFQDIGNRQMVMIRFNPDGYKNHKTENITSCWGYTKEKGLCHVKKTKQKEWQYRLETLTKYVHHFCKNRINKEIHVEHLFYDGWNL